MLIAVRAGRGIARTLSYQVADELLAGTLVRLLREFEPLAWPIRLVEVAHRTALPLERRLAAEANRLQGALPREAALVALDERGRRVMRGCEAKHLPVAQVHVAKIGLA